jgi:hypothetical protein
MFPDHLLFILHGALVGAGSITTIITFFVETTFENRPVLGLSPFISWLIFCESNSYGGIAMHTFGHLIQYLRLGFTL